MALMHPVGTRLAALVASVFVVLWLMPAAAQEIVHFPSADDNGLGQPVTELEGRLFRPNGEGSFPAVGAAWLQRDDAPVHAQPDRALPRMG
jgi:hypothetical protein